MFVWNQKQLWIQIKSTVHIIFTCPQQMIHQNLQVTLLSTWPRYSVQSTAESMSDSQVIDWLTQCLSVCLTDWIFKFLPHHDSKIKSHLLYLPFSPCAFFDFCILVCFLYLKLATEKGPRIIMSHSRGLTEPVDLDTLELSNHKTWFLDSFSAHEV